MSLALPLVQPTSNGRHRKPSWCEILHNRICHLRNNMRERGAWCGVCGQDRPLSGAAGRAPLLYSSASPNRTLVMAEDKDYLMMGGERNSGKE
ncbi:hypothetical protein RRG08_019006 [Elysia crispata]|uniref:Uncharacterized protein n=1 Tax=Elysia crispata TaxID=231223 RepID=A0AAE1DT54_9GAST|nr:hypothetical protein RRG08_019006 [Elysia crispata]